MRSITDHVLSTTGHFLGGAEDDVDDESDVDVDSGTDVEVDAEVEVKVEVEVEPVASFVSEPASA